MTGVTYAELNWRTSSYSNGDQACVEYADHALGVAVRDSKDPDKRPTLDYSPSAWTAFLTKLR